MYGYSLLKKTPNTNVKRKVMPKALMERLIKFLFFGLISVLIANDDIPETPNKIIAWLSGQLKILKIIPEIKIIPKIDNGRLMNMFLLIAKILI